MASKLTIPLNGDSLNIVRRSELQLRDILWSKFGCTIADQCLGEGPGVAQHRRHAVTPEKRFETVLRSGVRVTVWKADLTNFSVTAVVNAANDHLHHGGGLAGALSQVGGPKIQKDSNDHIKKYGPLDTGSAIISDAGLLRCRKIIHAVGPQLSRPVNKSDVAKAKPLLSKTIRNVLNLVQANQLDTVAIPAISSGLFHFPLPECANTIVTAVKDFFQKSSPHDYFPREVFFVNNDEPTVQEMDRACRQILGNTAISYSQAVANNSKGATKTTATTVEIGKLRVILKRGKIEEQKTDVIVNSTSSDRDLGKGLISGALLKKAGHELQKEMYRAPMGNIIITRGYKLQCKLVFHTFCSDTSEKGLLQNLSISVRECLWMMTTQNLQSIAFPAIATGQLGLSKSEAARIMLTEMADFGQKAPEPIEVHFVIFPSDKETFKAFESEMNVLHNDISHLKLSQAWYGEGSSKMSEYMMQHPPTEQQVWGIKDGSRPSTPQISLSGPSNEMTNEAKLWLGGILKPSSNVVSICNNFIQYFGEQDFGLLSQITQDIQMEEFLEKGRAGIIINASSAEDLAVFTIQVEALLCGVQSDFVKEEVSAIRDLLPNTEVVFERKMLDKHSREFKQILSTFQHQHLQVQKVEKVENLALEMLFEMKKKQSSCPTTRTMIQRLPAQFCEMVSHIGFHAECAPPDDAAWGEGIYFADSVRKAMEMWTDQNEEYMYFAQAEVITGKSTLGTPGLILPPPLGSDPRARYDSVSGGADIVVIFSTYQALPKYIITCKTA